MSEGDRPNILVIWGDDIAPAGSKLFNLRTDRFERADITSKTYYDWFLDNDHIALAGTAVMTQVPGHLQGLPAPPKAASFTIDQVVAKLENALAQVR